MTRFEADSLPTTLILSADGESRSARSAATYPTEPMIAADSTSTSEAYEELLQGYEKLADEYRRPAP